MKSVRALILVSFLLSLFCFDNGAFGQGGATGAISGTVQDTNGGAIAAADIQIISTATDALARRLTTGPDGNFEALLLPPARYYVVVNKSGFAEAKATGIDVRVTETTRLSITLKPGTVTEKVVITADVATVDTTNATTGESIGATTIRALPLATQNFQQLLTLSAGAQSDLNSSTQLGRGDVRIIVNGQREDNNNYLIEGISATDYNVARTHQHAAAERGRDPGIQGADFALRRDAGAQRRRQHQRHPENPGPGNITAMPTNFSAMTR